MDLKLTGLTALVTGASRGIGRAVAEELAREGCHLHLASRSAVDLEAVRAGIAKEHKVKVQCHALDLGVSANIATLAKAAGDVDILVNNAGVTPSGELLKIDEKQWREGWELKLFGYINLTREMLTPMMQRKSGVIVNVIGMAGVKPSFDYICGATANAALNAFTKGVGAGSVNHGVRVLGVNPAATRTDRIITLTKARAKTTFGDESRWEELLSNMPFGRVAHAEEVADTVVYCASDRASYLSGTMIDIDGGGLYR
ncbi:MAG: short-chain dehydrogenase/reductase [Betaproteobacteria bacterium]